MTQSRPLPRPQPETDFYWEKTKAHELWLSHCDDCTTTYFYPRAICPSCFSRNTRWLQSSGRGTLYAFTIAHRSPAPAFADQVPYIAAIVELDEGAHIPTNLIEIEPDPAVVKIGMRVEVVFEDVSDALALPKFRPASA
jgi:uncharacterized OB-fold protein